MLSRLLLGGLWIAFAAGQVADSTGLCAFLAERLHVSPNLARSLAWGVVGVEVALGLGIVAARRVRWLRPLGPVSLVLATALLALVVLDHDARTCHAFGALGLSRYSYKLAVLGTLLFLSALVCYPAPEPLPRGHDPRAHAPSGRDPHPHEPQRQDAQAPEPRGRPAHHGS